MTETIRILIVSHEALFRRGLGAMLASDPGLSVVGSVAGLDEAYSAADTQYPDVALIGTTIPDAPGIQAAADFHRRFASIAVIVVSSRPSDDEFFAAIRASAAAYCGQDVDETDLIGWIGRAARGEYPINDQLLDNPAAAARMLEVFRNDLTAETLPKDAFTPLTARELEILQKMSEGLTNAEIGYALGISAQTVKNHVTSILRKLAANDRTQAVVTALRNGWLTFD